MPKTPDRRPGIRYEDDAILFDDRVTDVGSSDRGFYRKGSDLYARDSVGVFNLRQLAAVGVRMDVTFSIPTPTGNSAFVPFDTTDFETHADMHDPTIADSGTATGTQTSTTLQDTTKSWTTDEYANHIVQITGGTGIGQWRSVTSNTSNTLTVAAWSTTPDATSTYRITEKSSRLVAPVGGQYSVIARASGAYQTLILGVQIWKNASFVSTIYTHQYRNIEVGVQLARIVSLDTDDYVQMKVYQGSGSAQNLFCSGSRLYFQMAKVG